MEKEGKDKKIPFCLLPHTVLFDKRISSDGIRVYAMIRSRCMDKEWCTVGQDRLAADLGMGLRSLERIVKELKHFRLIKIERRIGRTARTRIIGLDKNYTDFCTVFSSMPIPGLEGKDPDDDQPIDDRSGGSDPSDLAGHSRHQGADSNPHPLAALNKNNGEEEELNTGAGAPVLAEGQISGPTEAPEEEAEEAPEEALEETAKKFLNPNIAQPWEEAPDDESCPPAAPPQRATFAQVEAAVKITLPKKGQKNDGGRGPSACAVAPAPSDRPGTDHGETALAGWPMSRWSKEFIKAFNAQGFTVSGQKNKDGVSNAISEFLDVLGNEKLSYKERYHLLVEWLPRNAGKYKFQSLINVRFLAAKLREYLPAWKRSSRPRKPMDTSKIKVVDV